MKKALLLLTLSFILAACSKTSNPKSTETSLNYDAIKQAQENSTPSLSPSPTASTSTTPFKGVIMTKATIETSKGTIELELYPDKAPKTVENFSSKATSGFYKNLKFHRVEDWVIQGGDPLGNGTGGGKIATELSDVPFVEGSLGVARGGDITVSNDAQFFICTQECSWLNGQYTIFGKVTKGMDVVKKMVVGDKILSISTK